MMPGNLIAIFGPTGVGKTAVAIALAARLRARGEDPVAVSADALQIYAGLEILTGAADASEQAGLEHRLVACVPVSEPFSAGRYAQLAHAEIDALRGAGRRPILVGGTGLYLRAALTHLTLGPPVDPSVRAGLAARLGREGSAALHAELARQRPAVAAGIAPTDGQRVTRALELLAVGREPGKKTEEPGERPVGSGELWSRQVRVPTHLIGLTLERDALRAAIDRRIDAMLARGVVEEVRAAAAAGAGPSAAKAVGFRELLAGDVEAMRVRSRQYAKRQLTWMRKLPDLETIDLTGHDADWAADRILERLEPPDPPVPR